MSSDEGHTCRHLSCIDAWALSANYEESKLMPHTMKIWRKLIYRRIREEICKGEEQFGFRQGKTDGVNHGVVE